MCDPISDRSPSEAALELLGQLPAGRMGVGSECEVILASPIAKFRIDANVIRPRAGLKETAYRWGWRFFIASEANVLAHAIDVRPDRDAGRWRVGLVSGRQLAQQLALIDRIQSNHAHGGMLRLLDAPGLDWSGLWIACEADDRLISLDRGRPIKPARLMTKLRRTAQLQRTAIETRMAAQAAPRQDTMQGEE